MKKGFSLIVPMYNETTRLETGLREILGSLQKEKDPFELLLVDDGSDLPIDTLVKKNKVLQTQLSHMSKQGSVKFLRLGHNKGKGAAIGFGVNVAVYDQVLFSDLDCSVPLSFLPMFREALMKYDIAIASRRLPTSSITVHQPWVRESAGYIYTFLSNALCGLDVTDATCGFKAFRSDVAKKLFSQRTIDRWGFDTEVLFLARKYHCTIHELPVTWSNKTGSRVKFLDTVQSFMDLVSVSSRKVSVK